MTLEDRLRRIIDALPEEASVTLPVVVVREWLNQDGDDPLADLSVTQVAKEIGRSPGTVREWIRRCDLEAYHLGKEYRITRSALIAFREHQLKAHAQSDAPDALNSRSDLGAWRKLRRRKDQNPPGSQ